uniref:Inactive polyglycylase TTLL10 isoform X1 n=2 Tax=Pogona vitticeps TaxID=103695 RepID=A0ABM5EKN7_9SAUR
MKFLDQAKRYIGVPYAKNYHEPGSPEYESRLFLDCCGLIRRVMQDLAQDFGFSIGPGNQAYQYDTLPITVPSKEHLQPGDLIFISGTYFDAQRKRQPHDIVHVEIWLGDGDRSLGARWKRDTVHIFESYKFVSGTYGNMEYHFKSIETWLRGVCTSHCPEHKWASARELPGKRSIFHPQSDRDEPAEDNVGAQGRTSWSQVGDEKMALQVESLVESISNCELSDCKPMEALDLQDVCRVGPRLSGMDLMEQDQVLEAGQSQLASPESHPLESSSTNMGHGSRSLEAGQAQEEEGFKERTMETQTHGQEACERPGLIQDSLGNEPKKSTLKANSRGVLRCGGKKQKKKNQPGTQRNPSHFGGPVSDSKGGANRRDNKYLRMSENDELEDAQIQKPNSIPDLAEGEPISETKSKGPKNAPKPPPRGNLPEEKKPEESGPFFYIGGANGVEILNIYGKNRGWQRIYDNRREDYILKWCETKFRDTYYNFREGEQLLYQIPNNKILTTKIGLLMNLREYERVMRKINRNTKMLRLEDFFPETFRLDTKDEREIFFEIYREPQIWICKPTSSNQGRGIFLLKNEAEVNSLQVKLHNVEEDPMYQKLPYKTPPARIVQRYIDKPLLLEGKKFDVRSYLLIACTVPYMVFFGHGYVRLTCLNYDPKSEDLTSHLTNQYVQKKSPMYSHVKEETVWQMDRFNTYVNERFKQEKGLPKDWVFNGFTRRMKEIMLQCFLAVKSKLDCKLGYFDLIGCDFLIDEDFKVWLLEMNANPALHTNCNALKSIIPTVVNETLDLVIEIFTKIQKGQTVLPLESLCHFALLYNGSTLDGGVTWPTKSRTSLRSLRNHPSLPDTTGGGPASSTSTAGNPNSIVSRRPADKQPPKASEKMPKGEPPAVPEGTSVVPNKGAPRNPLPMPQIQISIIPSLSCCPSVKAIFRGNQVCNSGNQYIVKNAPSNLPESQPKAEGADDKTKMDGVIVAGGLSKDKSYAAWFQQTFGSKLSSAPTSNGSGGPLTSSQMVSLHLQSNLPPSLPIFQEFPKPFRHLMTHAKPSPSTDNTKVAVASRSCGDSLPEDKKISRRSS